MPPARACARRLPSLASALAALAIATGSAHAAAPDEIHWTVIDPHTVSFAWRGADDTLRYGRTSYDAFAVAHAPAPLPTSSPGPFREARLAGLEAGTLYHYAIGSGPDHTFRTPPPRGTSGFVVCVEGDIGGSNVYPNAAAVQALAGTQRPDFVIGLGDLTYADDNGLAAVDTHFNDVMAWSQDAAYMPAWGNHEWNSGDDIRNYKGRFDLPNTQATPGVPSAACCGDDWYWFDYGNVRFVVYPEPDFGAWADWFPKADAIMRAADLDSAITMMVTFGHRPAYTTGEYAPGDGQLRAYLDTLGVRHRKYVLNMNGHDHNFERTVPLRGVVHLQAGIGGGTQYPFGANQSWVAFRAVHLGIVRLEFRRDGIAGVMVCGPVGSHDDVTCTAGSVIDTFWIAAPTPPGPPPPNQAPTVSAGPDRVVASLADVVLDGTVRDDGQPAPPSLAIAWTPLDGPGTASLATPLAEDTHASFRETGVYHLSLTASDGALAASDTVAVTVQDAPATSTLERRVSSSTDDAEESAAGGVSLTSSDLELMIDGSTQRAVGMRFTNMTIPRGARITAAWLQLKSKESQTEATSVTIAAQAADNATGFATGNLSSRPKTAGVAWNSIPAWTVLGEAGGKEKSTDLSSAIQAVVNRSGWTSGNALALIVTGSGHRTARSWDNDPAGAALLHVEYATGPPVNRAPVVDAGPDLAIVLPNDAALHGAATDDGLPSPSVTISWSALPGPGPVAFANGAAADTRATFTVAGTHRLVLSASDGALAASDTVTVVVQPAGAATTTLERRVSSSSDDAEESAAGGMSLTSSDLELMIDGSTQRAVGMRFTNVTIPRGARITAAWLQLKSKESQSEATSVTIAAQAADNATGFGTGNLSSRAKTVGVAWNSIPAWTVLGEAGGKEKSTDLSSAIQAVVNRSGWTSGNALALIVTGSGHRTARSWDNDPAGAALLHVEYSSGAASATGPTTPPRFFGASSSPLALALRVVPNPLRGSAALEFTTPRAGSARLEIFDVRGRRVGPGVSWARLAAGRHDFALESLAGGRLPAGIYFARLRAGSASVGARFVVLD